MEWKRIVLLSSAVMLFAAPLRPQASPSPAVREAGETYFSWLKEDRPDIRMRLGLPVERLPDLSQGKLERDAARAAQLAKRLERIDARTLAHEDDLSLDVLKRRLSEMQEAPRFYWLRFDVTPYASPIGPIGEVFARWSFPDDAAADRYLRLLRQYPALIQVMTNKVRGQAAHGIRLNREELDLAVGFLHSCVAAPDKSPYGVAGERLVALPAERAAAFQRNVALTIRLGVNPVLTALADQLTSPDGRSKAPSAVGLAQYPGGRAYYEWLVRFHTTLPVTPEELHRIGLSAVERLGRQMDEVQARVGFAGTRQEFRASLSKDPRFFPKTPEEVGQRLMGHVRRIEPSVDTWFLRRPKAPYAVKRLDPTLEGGQTFGYYTPPTAGDPTGYYLYNASDLEHRSLLNAAGLIAHELIPGHHFQINLAYENEKLPPFRRESADTAYTEGWGEYAASLAGEMGMYADPYDLYGRLAMESFIATRLVVDTGMNALGWTRERAAAYMRENEMETDAQIRTESLRYCCDIPGQALAYHMGHQKILELREKARAALGDRFDVRRFHDAILGSGSLPLTTLERHIDWFIEQEKKAATH